jgi:phage gp16-like protein
VSQLKAFIKKYNVKVLNVAGNRESKLTPDQLFKFKNVMKQAFPKPKTLQTDQFDAVEGEVKPETTSKIKDILKSKGRVNEELLGQFWDNEINDNQERKQKTGFNTYGNMLATYKEVNSAFELSEEEFIEQTRCKF